MSGMTILTSRALRERRRSHPSLRRDSEDAMVLRNYLVHRYDGLDEEIVLDSIEEVKRTLLELLGVSERLINGLTKT